MSHSNVIIIDYGSQYTQLITPGGFASLGVYAKILPGDFRLSQLESASPQAVILSGGPSSVYDAGAPQLPEGFFDLQARSHFSVLGICYGMQLVARSLGGEVKKAKITRIWTDGSPSQREVHSFRKKSLQSLDESRRFHSCITSRISGGRAQCFGDHCCNGKSRCGYFSVFSSIQRSPIRKVGQQF